MDPNCSDSSSDAANEEFWNLANSSSDEEELLNLEITTILEKQENLEREQTRRGGSVIGRAFIDRNRLQCQKTLYDDYFAEIPVHKEVVFRRRFRMHRPLFLRILNAVEAHDSYLVQKRNSPGLLGLSSLQKGTAAIRMLAYGVGANVMDDYLRMGESTAIKSMRRFVQAVIDVFGNEYLRKPNTTDISRLMSIGESRGFRGMLGSIDWSHNDINVLEHQEGCRKDVERAFGVLQACFAIVRGPARFWDRETLQKIMTTCVIMHNMIIEDQREEHVQCDDHETLARGYAEPESEIEDVVVLRSHAIQFEDFINNHLRICDRETHSTLQADLVEHLWQRYSMNVLS